MLATVGGRARSKFWLLWVEGFGANFGYYGGKGSEQILATMCGKGSGQILATMGRRDIHADVEHPGSNVAGYIAAARPIQDTHDVADSGEGGLRKRETERLEI